MNTTLTICLTVMCVMPAVVTLYFFTSLAAIKPLRAQRTNNALRFQTPTRRNYSSGKEN